MRRTIILMVGLLLTFAAEAQEFLGVRNSNYAGIQSVFLNPSAISGSKLSWDVNVISEGSFFDNNFFFVPKGQLPVLGFGRLKSGIVHEDLFYNHYDPQNPNKLYQIVLSNELVGPSFFASLNRKSQIGFTYAVRGYVNIQNVPGHLAQNAFTNLEDKSLWNIPWHDSTTRINSMGWVEYGLHYSRMLYRKNKHEWRGGISFKFLQGVASAYSDNPHLNYTVLDATKVVLTNSSLDYGGTKHYPVLWPSGTVHGHGVSGDLGVTYVYTRDPSTCPPDKDKEWGGESDGRYTLRVGFSVLDVGTIHFNQYTSAHHLQADSAVYSNLRPPTSTQLNETVTDIFHENDSLKHLVSNQYYMSLPPALSLQVDWNVLNQFYLNATLIKGLGHGNNLGIIRPDIYSLTPRYETRIFEVSVPFSMLHYHYWVPRVGVAFRIAWFFIGADAPGGLFGLKDYERSDIYAGIRVFNLGLSHKQNLRTPCTSSPR